MIYLIILNFGNLKFIKNMKISKICLVFFITLLFINISFSQINSTHNITIAMFPDSSFLTGIDEIAIQNPTAKMEFHLLRSIEIIEILSNEYTYKIDTLDNYYNKIIFTSKGQNKSLTNLKFSYKGKIYNPPEEINLTQRHSNSAGIISAKKGEGIYLPAGSFYPTIPDELSNFTIKASIPTEFTLITSGDAELISANPLKKYSFKTKFPTDEITIVGGRYIEQSKEYDGKKFTIYTYDSTSNADTYLDSSISYYKLYTNLFGEYPYQSFSIVDNFFATGFGMPGYTLLSGKLLNMPWVLLSPGSLAHEFVHNWWGNSVYTDYEKGNWCEALTTFSANYYYNVLTENTVGAEDWRKKALLSINSLPKEKNYPVIDFKYQRDSYDAVIGYDKGSFIFYEIYKLLGRDSYFNTLKSFANNYRGKKAYWSDLISEFSKNSQKIDNKYQLDKIINKWLASSEIPTINLVSTKKNGNKISIKVHKSSDFVLSLPILFIGDNKSEMQYFIISDETTTINHETNFKVNRIELDPNYEVLRTLYNWEKPYNFNRTLAANPIIVLPNENSTDYEVANQLVKDMKESGWDFPIKNANKITEEEIRNNSLILLGNNKNNIILKNSLKLMPNEISVDDKTFHFKNKEMNSNEIIMLSNIDHPSNNNKLCTIVYFDGLKDFTPLKRLFHYQSYSLVVLGINKPGRPLFDIEIFPNISDKSQMQVEIK